MEGAIWEAVNNPSATSEQLELLPEVARLAKENGDIQALDKSIYSYKCNVCEGKKPFTGLQPLQAHLNGKDHKKMKRLIEMTSATKISDSSNSPTQNALLPDSTISALPTEIQKLLENKTIKMVETSGIISYECLICKVALTNDLAPVKQHINGRPHEKKMKQMSLYVADSQGFPQPPEDMEWNNTNSSQTQEPNQYQTSNEIPKIIYPDSPMMDDSDTYKNLTNPRGLVYIFNNTFTGSGRYERRGSKQDTKNLTILFHNMGYKVKFWEDLNKNTMLQKLIEIQNEEELKIVDSLIVVIMSHGDPKDERRFYSNDMESIELDEVRYRFTHSQCKALIGKAKIVLSNFCRGNISEIPAKLESDAPVNYAGRDAPRDMCTIHASISGFEAKRHPEKGTVFAQSLCKVLSQYSHNTEMADLYRALCREMNKVTTPEQQNYFFLKFYFNPTPPGVPLPENTP